MADDADYKAILEAFLAENRIAGGTLHVSGPDEEVEVSSGVADVRSGQAVTAETRFYIASLGKMVVATAILADVETGKLDLDASIWPLVSDIPQIASLANVRDVSLRQLLNHTSGFPDYLSEDFAQASARQPDRRWTEAEVLAFAYDWPPLGSPGQVFEYSNTNYVLLGHILKRSRSNMETALRDSVLAKAGMTSTSVGAAHDELDLARGYAGSGRRTDVSREAWARATGDGPLVGTVGDVSRFMRALLRDGKLIGPDLVREMLSGSGPEEGYGLGIGIDGDEWGDWYGHAGGDDGFEADVRYYPDSDVVIAFSVNGNTHSDTDLLDQAAEIYFER
ncbi:serine hydrolase domain-containing protein [Hoeflea sp. AS60]|uniref:serine hydrolase domain-containing protein n=1 Tax=Hoeflea sp. AS60 TaxID=3135780 RepID=UPI00317347B5